MYLMAADHIEIRRMHLAMLNSPLNDDFLDFV